MSTTLQPARSVYEAAHPMLPIELIGAEIGEGASDPGCRDGARALARAGLAAQLAACGRPAARWGPIVSADAALRARSAMAVVEEFSPRLARAVTDALERGCLPLVLGGDHSCAVGTWSAAAAVLRRQERACRTARGLGLVWIDAHLDSHTPQTSESQAPHGMPLAALLGHGPAALTELAGHAPKLDARDVVVIGARSWEPDEHALLRRLGVRVMPIDEVHARGIHACLHEAVAHASAHTAAFGLSFDLDVLDPQDAPGTGTPVEGGVRLAEALEALETLPHHERLIAAEIVEYNPGRDRHRRTARAAIAVAVALARVEAGAIVACPRRRRRDNERGHWPGGDKWSNGTLYGRRAFPLA